jgi:hypothetical protein
VRAQLAGCACTAAQLVAQLAELHAGCARAAHRLRAAPRAQLAAQLGELRGELCAHSRRAARAQPVSSARARTRACMRAASGLCAHSPPAVRAQLAAQLVARRPKVSMATG